jgi:hypothetical protein
MILTQTTALFVDAYRELNAKKLFWITLLLSIVVIFVMAAMGIDEKGVSIFGWTLEFIPITTAVISKEMFYKGMFSNLGISIWLTWVAAILALVSTAGIFPDLIAGGSIESVLSKPIGRSRLFLTKYCTGLLFVGLQVLVFSVGSFLVFGLRANLWEPRLFLAVPIVVTFFSYLFCVCALIGLISRSTITALLVTMLLWAALFLVNTADVVLQQIDVQLELRSAAETERIALMERNTSRLLVQANQQSAENPPDWTPSTEEINQRNPFIKTNRERLTNMQETRQKLAPWLTGVYIAKTVLPKTGETAALLERWLIDLSELPDLNEAPTIDLDDEEIEIDQEEMGRELQERFRSRSVAWVVGTSLIFQCFILGLCLIIFVRRDF